ncbi:MAG: N-acetylmuramoyl-L-alanine amidase [Gammaproteobacteria bacterium]|nr:N-acetylmuramoyl-L-alanine amidase [Gammaproteobacteria bacterium]
MYSSDSPILGVGTVSAEAIDAWLRAIGPTYVDYAPDKTYRPAPPVGQDIIGICRHWGINWDLMAAQIVKESAAWQSAISRDKNNPSGLGAVNDNAYDGAVTFESPALGIRATAAHLMTYATGDGDWAASDPRYDAVKAKGWLGVAKTWGDLDGKWAWPGDGYGRGVAELANQLIDYANNEPWKRPLLPPGNWKAPEIIQRLLPRNASNTPQKTMNWQYVTVHNTGNPSAGADALMHAQYLLNLAAARADEPSWQYTVDDTRITQSLADDQAGYHASDGSGPGNMESLGVELVEVGNQELVLWNAGWLIAKKLREKGYGIERVRQHHDWARDGKDCPRLLRANNGAGWARLLEIVTYFLLPQPHALLFFPETGKTLGGGFRWYWENRGGLEIFGYPISDEMSEDGRTVQYFERAVFEYHPEQEPRWTVMLRRIGVESYARRYESDSEGAA